LRRSASPGELRRLCRGHNKSAGTVSAKVRVFRSAIIRAGVHLVLGWLVMFHMQFYQWGHFQSKAITVPVMNHASAAEDPRTQPLMLRVQSAGPGLPPKLCLNSKLLRWVELNSRLQAELSRRSVSLVYVEADPNVADQDVLEAIDASRILNAKGVSLRTEFK